MGFFSEDNTYIDSNGYYRFTDSNILVHRWVAEKKVLGRKLRRGEVVHHKDRNKRNNDPDNLWVFKNQYEHDRIHKMDAYNHGKKASYQGFGNYRNRNDENNGCGITFLAILGILVLSSFLLLK